MRKIVMKKPNGEIEYVRFDVSKDMDLTRFRKLGEEMKNECKFSIIEGNTCISVWFDFRKED